MNAMITTLVVGLEAGREVGASDGEMCTFAIDFNSVKERKFDPASVVYI